MALEYKINEEKNLISINVTGKTTETDWYGLFYKAKKNTKRKEEMNVLIDFRKHETVVSTEVVRKLCSFAEKKEKKVKWAFIISRNVSLGMANMASFLIEEKNIDIKAFENENDALEWVLE